MATKTRKPSAKSDKKIPVTLIPGDGIGTEVTEATLEVLEAVGAPFEYEWHLAGVGGLQKLGDPLPKDTIESIRKTRLALKGPLATPVGEGYRSVNVALRKEFDLYANVRPAQSFAGVETPCTTLDARDTERYDWPGLGQADPNDTYPAPCDSGAFELTAPNANPP